MRILYILVIIIATVCVSLKSRSDSHVGCIEILQIKNIDLLTILDSIIIHEKQCFYYTPNLNFSIHSQIINDTMTEFQIGAFGSELVKFDDNHYKGCFEHKGHWFFVEGNKLNETIFIKTNQKKIFTFYKQAEDANDGKIIVRVYEDDTFSFWIYHYINGEFILREMFAPYCEK